MSFSILRTPGINMPFQRVAKVDSDLDLAIAFAKVARTDIARQDVQVWENWPPRGREKLRWLAKAGEPFGEMAAEKKGGKS